MPRFVCALLVSALVVASTFPAGSEDGAPAPFHFALLGDVPYSDEEEVWFLGLLDRLNTDATLAFVVHDGDFKSGRSPCTDELFLRRREQFQTSAHPLIFIFGDNEWTDCHREAAGKYDPVERLNKLREIFTEGRETLGRRTLLLSRQSDDPRYGAFRENIRWTVGPVLFVGLNVPGSYNNVKQRQEYGTRNRANIAWLRDSFRLASESGARGVMVIIQGNPRFHALMSRRNPYGAFLAALERETRAFGKPVVLVHGDTHHFQIDKPMRDSRTGSTIENLTRVETFGSPDLGWIRATVDVNDPALFRFEPKPMEPAGP